MVLSSPALVLIAEDELPIAEIVADVVADAGHASLIAPHGRAALDLARAHRPALIITDLMMPLLDGAALVAALRADAAAGGFPPPPIILMTASGVARAAAVGADVVLLKPFDLAELEALLGRFLPSAVGVGGT
ncbi:MAG: hypothetical protein AVDCRST_MAG18-4307 [uncultured Thermomicrobiales bacterium]|uniref:Response regulatory domain-containing protein n=1 Tax=uncultured Thermomicrobiales bacterium TaxID=1645740 RepID=A0A6J4VWU4_9BACT|nr:MAG: hypothetical protein AVDCRST_MAG18-4307 [uncultured Thermomicrobiales bacterium]